MEKRGLAVLALCLVAVSVIGAVGLLYGLGDGTSTNGSDGTSTNGSDGTSTNGSDGTNTNGSDGTDEFNPPDPATMPGELAAESTAFAGFEDVATGVGLEYETIDQGRDIIDSHGPYVVDFNNNGHEDLLLVGGERPVLFENTGGGFEVATEFDMPGTRVAHFFDYDNDGNRDLMLVTAGEPPVLFENDGGSFTEVDVGFDEPVGYPTTVTSADFTGNGCLDLYIGDWGTSGEGSPPMRVDNLLNVVENHPKYRPQSDFGHRNHFYAGDCTGFKDVTEESDVGGSDFTLAVSAADLTGDGNVDLHVGNEWTADVVYANRGTGTFEAIDLGPNSDRNAMSSVAMDMTGNHYNDLFVTNVYYPEHNRTESVPNTRSALPFGNNLFANEGNATFTDIAPEHGLEKGSWGWATTIADYTNDGHLDVIHASSYSNIAAVDLPDSFRPPQVWKGTGETWEKIDGFEVGFEEHNFRGVARIDYNMDGTLDFIGVGNPSQTSVAGVEAGKNRSFLYENQLNSDDSLQLWIRNPNGLERNAKVYIETDERTIYREANAQGDLLSQDSRLIHVGTANEAVQRVAVVWPEGTTTLYDSVKSGNRYIITPTGIEHVEPTRP